MVKIACGCGVLCCGDGAGRGDGEGRCAALCRRGEAGNELATRWRGVPDEKTGSIVCKERVWGFCCVSDGDGSAAILVGFGTYAVVLSAPSCMHVCVVERWYVRVSALRGLTLPFPGEARSRVRLQRQVRLFCALEAMSIDKALVAEP